MALPARLSPSNRQKSRDAPGSGARRGDLATNDDPFEHGGETTAVFDREMLMKAVAQPAARKSHVLLRMDGSDVGQVFTLNGNEVTVGRHTTNHLVLTQDGISRRHARFIFAEGAYRLEDLQSANGCFVGGARIQQYVLHHGDVVQFGPRVLFRYSVTDSGEEQMLRQLYEASVKDSLTGIYNREYLNERLKAEVAFARRHATQSSLLLFDVDHFKRVNDTYGHPAGDAVLVGITKHLSRLLRTEDVFARYGGEEFAVSLRGIDLAGCERVGQRLRETIASTTIEHAPHRITCTVSVGCSALTCCSPPSVEELIAVADRRLYAAKRNGRNRVVSAG